MSESSAARGNISNVTDWREIYQVHPCADVYPMVGEAELEELAKNIVANGLLHPVVVWRDESTSAQWFVLDGRNRLEALTRAGIEIPSDPSESSSWRNGTRIFTKAMHSVDPAAYVIGANIRRRHLTKEQQAELIVKTIDAGQSPTVQPLHDRSTRGSNGRVHGSTKDPKLTAAIEEGKKHGISKRTVQIARAKLHGKPSKTSTIEPTVTLPPPPPSTYEWVDDQLTTLRTKHRQILDRYAELDATAPKLSPAERRTVCRQLIEVRSRIDKSILHFGGRHTAPPAPEDR